MNGVINVNKPEGWTSQDVCAKLRSRLHIKKIGHTGTLDPMATGVLPVCIGKATRIIEYYDNDIKSYRASMKLGMTSNTLDITGEIQETTDCSNVSSNAVREAFKAYTGTIEQLPPKYSALKVNGKRAYELAREGKDFVLAARRVEIYANEILAYNIRNGEVIYKKPGFNDDVDTDSIAFEVTCSKGTYIRSMIDDIGRSLGCGAVMTALERNASGFFKIEDAIDIEELCALSDEEIKKRVITMDETLINLGVIQLNDNRVTAFINGNDSYSIGYTITEDSNFKNSYRVYNRNEFIGIGSVENDTLKPQKVINANI